MYYLAKKLSHNMKSHVSISIAVCAFLFSKKEMLLEGKMAIIVLNIFIKKCFMCLATDYS